MDAIDTELELVSVLRARLSDDAARTDAWVEERGLEGECMWLEAFAGRVSDAVRDRRGGSVATITDVVAACYRAGSVPVKSAIDVFFAENVMWDADNAARVWAWPFIAPEIRRLYAEMWGTSFLDQNDASDDMPRRRVDQVQEESSK